jgi:hypothetical protein
MTDSAWATVAAASATANGILKRTAKAARKTGVVLKVTVISLCAMNQLWMLVRSSVSKKLTYGDSPGLSTAAAIIKHQVLL